ncbi:hypothetical protein [Aliidiomarina celeris]|uniref:hypothetical protein n=1 Tax=Aliidiomarina celeris TaxID=2249428 RepID=UPI000DE84527|nr:hypothetical protein [Aliidiomarina celeris]
MIQFRPLLETLLAGQFICPVSAPEHYKKLQDIAIREAIDDYLQPLNRRVASSDDESVYFLAYRDIDNNERDLLKQQLSVVMSSLLPLLEWLTYVQEVQGSDGALSAGDTLKLQELILKTEDNPSLRQRLQALATDKFFNSQADSVDAQARQIAKRLVEHGYLLQPHKERLYFQVTGKIDYLIELVRFIKDEENIPLSEEQVQEDLF